MALIKCKGCGHDVSDKALACPHCGHPVEKTGAGQDAVAVERPEERHRKLKGHVLTLRRKIEQQDVAVEEPKKSKALIWVLAAVLFGIVAGVGYGLLKDDSKTPVLADGRYCYTGEWKSGKYAASPCKIEFTIKDGLLENCSYTNLGLNAQMSLIGTIKDGNLHFESKSMVKLERASSSLTSYYESKPGKSCLVINLKVSSDWRILTGEGVDNTNDDNADLTLTNMYYQPVLTETNKSADNKDA